MTNAITPDGSQTDQNKRNQDLFCMYNAKLIKYGKVLTGNWDDGADAAQKTWEIACAKGVRAGCELAWLLLVTRHNCLRILRDKKKHPAVSIDCDDLFNLDDGNPITDLEAEEERLQLRELIRTKLPKMDQVIVLDWLTDPDRHSDQIAVALNIKPDAARKRLSRALERLRNIVPQEWRYRR